MTNLENENSIARNAEHSTHMIGSMTWCYLSFLPHFIPLEIRKREREKKSGCFYSSLLFLHVLELFTCSEFKLYNLYTFILEIMKYYKNNNTI